MEETVRKSPAPFYAVAVVWLVYALLFPLYKPLHYVLLGAALVLALNRLPVPSDRRRRRRRPRKPKPPRRTPPETRPWTRCSRTAAWPSRR